MNAFCVKMVELQSLSLLNMTQCKVY